MWTYSFHWSLHHGVLSYDTRVGLGWYAVMLAGLLIYLGYLGSIVIRGEIRLRRRRRERGRE